MSPHSYRKTSLKLAFLSFILVQTVTVAVLGFVVHRQWQQEQMDGYLAQAVSVRAQGATAGVYYTLNDMWGSVEALSATLTDTRPEDLSSRFDALGSLAGVSWAGLAALDGTVTAASQDMLLGKDVSSRPWFTAGMKGNFAGDVHEAVLLNKLLGGSEEEPIRFVDFATPVRNSAGDVTGVLGIHIDTAWLQSYLDTVAAALSIDLFVVGADGTIQLGTASLATEVLDLPSLKTAAAGVQTSGNDAWPDGHRYFTAAIPGKSFGNMPSFGWTIVARIDPRAFGEVTSPVTDEVQKILVIAFGVILLASFLFWRLYLAPVARIAQAGQLIAQGHLVAPPEEVSTREYADISMALTKLQAKNLASESNLRSRPGPIRARLN